MCGKNKVTLRSNVAAPGSPPRVREKLIRIRHRYDITGITPACAGKTTVSISTVRSKWDQSHVCGKNTTIQKVIFLDPGSPSHMREKLTCFFLIIFNRRITPACAGKTSSALICLSWSWDHPRVCGKNISDILKMVRVLGSPPLLREKRISTPFVQVNCGITPACAGKTFDSIWECQSC